MADVSPPPTINLRERTFSFIAAEDRLPKWLTVSFVVHAGLIFALFAVSILPRSHDKPPPVYTVDLVGGAKIGKANYGTEITPVEKNVVKKPTPPAPEVADSKITKPEKTIVVDKKPPAKEAPKPVEKKSKDAETPVKASAKQVVSKEVKSEARSEALSADKVRERLIQAAAERAKDRTETAQKTEKKENLSFGAGEGEGAASLGAGGRGGPGVVKGLDFIIYQNRMLSTIKNNWAWVGQRANLKVVVQFGIKDNGEIVGLKIVQASGDATYDDSVLRAVKKSSPLPAPPVAYRSDFSEVELTFRPRDLGA